MRHIGCDFTRNEILEIAREFKKRRSFLGLSQLKLAKFAGLSQSVVNKFENGKIDPTYSTIVKIEKALSEEESISNLKAKDVMISDVMFVKPDSKISEALDFMLKNDFSQLVVFDDGVAVGTVYEKTILEAISRKVDIYETEVGEFVEPNPIIVPLEYSVSDLSYIFQNKRTKFVLVGEKGKVLGLITKSDLFKK